MLFLLGFIVWATNDKLKVTSGWYTNIIYTPLTY